MALKNTYTGRRYNREQMEREFDNPMSYGTEDQKYRRYDNPNYRSNYNDNQDQQRLESIYGDDTANYGNANQGSFDREWWERMRNRVAGWFGSDKEMNREHGGKYSGVGPKNYKRNEQRIYEDVCDLLMDNDGIDASEIEVQLEGNYVILSGAVHTRTEKRRAEDLALSVPGVYDVENRLRVKHQNYLQS
jgi:osmotically-inducible protein OsmY